MPNWCSNEITLSGPKDVIDEIVDSKFLLQNLFPCPQDLLDTTSPAEFNDKDKAKENVAKYGYPDWYSWQVANWGTKWDIGPVDNLDPIQIGDKYELSFYFESAWSPPVEAMKNLHEKYSSRGLEFTMEYYEGGCCFLGVCSSKDGEFDDEYEEFSCADELEKAVKLLSHQMGESELEYVRQYEQDQADSEVEEEAKANEEKPKKPAKSGTKTTKKAEKPAKKTEKTAKKRVKATKTADEPVKKTAKKSTKKPVKKAAKTKKTITVVEVK